MKKTRLSKNQKDALFVLAVLETKRFTRPVPVPKMRELISQSRPGILDASNFRKGLHVLEDKGFIELLRAKDLSLAAKLTQKGREQAAKIHFERTGVEMATPPEDEKQMTIFDNE
ncbi:TPA: hypothetical protein I7144_20650 [Vibrio vulnificus]|nr:hypothetical protein [Vibrio vulnificus]